MTLREKILTALADGGPFYDFSKEAASEALEALILREQKKKAAEAIGEALWSFVVWNHLTDLSTPQEFKKQLDRILENQMSNSNLFPS